MFTTSYWRESLVTYLVRLVGQTSLQIINQNCTQAFIGLNPYFMMLRQIITPVAKQSLIKGTSSCRTISYTARRMGEGDTGGLRSGGAASRLASPSPGNSVLFADYLNRVTATLLPNVRQRVSLYTSRRRKWRSKFTCFFLKIRMCLEVLADLRLLRCRLVALKAKIQEQKKHLEELDNLVYFFNRNIARALLMR